MNGSQAVIVDANALMAPVESGVRLFEELDRVLPEPAGHALARPAGGGGLAYDSAAEEAEHSGPGDDHDEGRRGPDDERGVVFAGRYELVTPRAVLKELDRLADAGNGAEAKAASVGADLARERCRIVDHDAEYADDAVAELARPGVPVVTNDRPLRERLLEADVPVIGLRGRTALELTQP